MTRERTDKPSVDYTPELDVAALDWAQGTQRVYFQTSKVKLTRNTDGTFDFKLTTRINKPKEFRNGGVYEAQLQSLASALDATAQGSDRAAFEERLKHLSAPEVGLCLAQVQRWFVNSTKIADLHPLTADPVPESVAPEKKKRGLLRFLHRADRNVSEVQQR